MLYCLLVLCYNFAIQLKCFKGMKFKQLFSILLLLLTTVSFARDYQIISTNGLGEVAELESRSPSISGNSRFIAFTSESGNLAELDNQHASFSNIFVKDLLTGQIIAVDVPVVNTHQTASPSISADGLMLVASASSYQFDYIFSKRLDTGESMVSKQQTNAIAISGDGLSWYYNVENEGGFRGRFREFPYLENEIEQHNGMIYLPGAFDITDNGSVVQVNQYQQTDDQTHFMSSDTLVLDTKVIYRTINDMFVNNALTNTVSISANGEFVLFAKQVMSKLNQPIECVLKLIDTNNIKNIINIDIPNELSINHAICGTEALNNAVDVSADGRFILINGVQLIEQDINSSILLDRLTGKYEFVFVDENGNPLTDFLLYSSAILSDDGAYIVFTSADKRLNGQLKNSQVLITNNPLFNQ